MIKKILSIIICLCALCVLPYPAKATNFTMSDTGAVMKVLEKHFSGDLQAQMDILNVYIDAVDGGHADVNTLSNMCAAAGVTSKKACIAFLSDLLWAATGYYESACATSNLLPRWFRSGHISLVCDKTFESYTFLHATATALAQEYAKIKLNDDIVCDKQYRNSNGFGFLRCKSINTLKFYEFKFDSLESGDAERNSSMTIDAIFKIYGVQFGKPMKAGGCKKMTSTAKRFGYIPTPEQATSTNPIRIAPQGSEFCVFKPVSGYGSNQPLTTMCGIDNFAFCQDIETTLDIHTHGQLEQYVAEKCNTHVNDISCTYGTGVYYGKKCNPGIDNYYDDIISCYYNGNKVDFVFDDLSEPDKITSSGGKQAMSCIILDGTYNGRQCMHISQAQCEAINENILQNCPNCVRTKWNPTTGVCELPDAATDTERQKIKDIAIMIIGAGAAVVVTVATGGLSSPVTAVVFVVETAGAAIEIAAQTEINKIPIEFFDKSAKCHQEDCAIALIEEFLITLARMNADLSQAEASAADQEMARLVALIPEDSEWWYDNLKLDDGTSLLAQADDGGWTPEQIWRAIGIGMQFASVATSITGWIVKQSRHLTTTLPKTTAKLTEQAKISRTKLGIKLVKRSDRIAEAETKITKLLDDLFWQKTQEIYDLRKTQDKIEQKFIEKYNGKLFHGSATNYEEGKVQALSKAWQIHSFPDSESLLFATKDFYTAKGYAHRSNVVTSVKDLSSTVSIPVPKQFTNKDLPETIRISDRRRKNGYVYAVKPDGFEPDPSATYMMIDHDVDRVARIEIPLDTDIIFFEKKFPDKFPIDLLIRMGNATRNIDAGKNISKNLEVYAECLEELAKILK